MIVKADLKRNKNKSIVTVICLAVSFIFVSTWAYGQQNNQTSYSLNKTTGLIDAPGHNSVAAHCSACHSPKLIAQNNMSRERWLSTIRWMQNTQKLWPLGDAEAIILDYLSTWYGPKNQSRRPPIAPHLMPPLDVE